MRDPWRPSVTVAAVIERGGRYLLVEEEVDGRRVLNQPAGHLDPGESLAAACAREVLEETAHRFTPRALVGIYRWRYPAKDVTFLRFCFCGDLRGEEAGRSLDRGIVAARWLSFDEALARKAEHRSPLVEQCLRDFRAGRRYPLEVLSAEFA
jgi:8-oxo-dGTP pyrophosphatase MutT (NUDIX family)